ncbi:unnamed protein product [Protopolystoma xenopodis]|uniref:Uncharacterized protein n=1 Tax=Protopolystoma xenopodis TaxID=117903 RepID=A0A448WG63_9PLAT|nr:unnamed protein product [Protopolystoma xenopodis]
MEGITFEAYDEVGPGSNALVQLLEKDPPSNLESSSLKVVQGLIAELSSMRCLEGLMWSRLSKGLLLESALPLRRDSKLGRALGVLPTVGTGLYPSESDSAAIFAASWAGGGSANSLTSNSGLFNSHGLNQQAPTSVFNLASPRPSPSSPNACSSGQDSMPSVASRGLLWILDEASMLGDERAFINRLSQLYLLHKTAVLHRGECQA